MLARVKNSRIFLLLSKVPLTPQDAFPLLVVIPLAGFYFIRPAIMFELTWIGYAALIYAAFFVILTWLYYRMAPKEEKRAETRVAWPQVILFLAGISVYQLLLYGTELPQLIYRAGVALGLRDAPTPALSLNWTVSIDFIVFTVYTVGLTTSFFNVKSLKYFLGPIIYSVALISAFLIDAAYPLGKITVLQQWVPAIVFLVANFLRALRVNVTYSKDVLYTPSGVIVVGWPCAGIHSLLIYTAVAYSFLQTLEISKVRKLIYLIIGFFGTYMINILRIAVIIFGNYYFNWDIYMMHYYAGELFFIVWIVVFLFLVIMTERRRVKAKKTTPASKAI